MTLANYYFIPTVREGLAAYITGAPATSDQRAVIQACLTPYVDGPDNPQPGDCTPAVPNPPYCKNVALYGPGDVLGFDSSVVTRTDPRLNVWDYEPNYMPLVEFSEPDLPWRFTPTVADASKGGKLQPWLTLIVLGPNEFEGLGQGPPPGQQESTIPMRWIKQVSVDSLPDLTYAWMWAHVQVTSDDSLPGTDPYALSDALAAAIAADPEEVESHVVGRLICPRRLGPQTRYTAFVVPTFKLGLVAAGFATVDSLDPNLGAVTPAWTKADGKIDLSYYYKWEFGTGVREDFESLVRLLEPRELTDLGKRRMDCSTTLYAIPPCPGDDSDDPQVVQLEGALISPDLQPATWHNDASTATRDAYQAGLASLLNLPTTLLTAGSATPPVTPPVFGRRHSGRPAVDATKLSRWQDDTNLDPRQRAAAGFGALVVQKEQEALMAGVWDQLGDIDQANDLLRSAQLGLEASKGTYKRLGTLALADFLWTAAPVFARVRAQVPTAVGPTTVARYLGTSPIPGAAFDPAFRRILRRRGGLRKRQKSVPPPPAGQDLLSRLNRREIAAAGRSPKLSGLPAMCDLTEAAIATLDRNAAPARRTRGVFRINGRVIDSRNRRGLEGVRVEAWDKDPFFSDLVEETTTDERGAFRIDFDATYFKEWFLDRRPDLFFKVFRGERPMRVIEPGVLRNIEAGDRSVTVVVEPPIAPEHVPAFRVSGQVVDRTTRNGVPWVRVEAWDKDPLINDLVGTAVTDEQGRFRVEFEQSYFKEWLFDRRPDLFFKVFDRDRLLASTEHAVMSNLPPGEKPVPAVEVDAPTPPAHPPGPPSVADFCEPAITSQTLNDATANGADALHQAVAAEVRNALDAWLDFATAPTAPPAAADLDAVHSVVKAAVAPWATIPARIAARLRLGPGVHQRGELGRIESDVEFPQPMYEPLSAISQDLILPGVETVPQNTISILKANRRFIEAYMLGLNGSLSSEALWRGAPVYLWTTFFRQFWDVHGLADPDADPELSKDIARLTKWNPNSELGDHDPRNTSPGALADTAVLLLRGDLLKRYPNTLVYAVKALAPDQPGLKEYVNDDSFTEDRIWPIFSGSLAPDLTFLGFPRTPYQLCKGEDGNGYFIVLEERLGEPRFGFDLPDDTSPAPQPTSSWWFDLTWASLQRTPVGQVEENTYIDDATPAANVGQKPIWGSSAAAVANISLQRPVRVCVHASKMLSETACQPPTMP
jgi:hypothetical protein